MSRVLRNKDIYMNIHIFVLRFCTYVCTCYPVAAVVIQLLKPYSCSSWYLVVFCIYIVYLEWRIFFFSVIIEKIKKKYFNSNIIIKIKPFREKERESQVLFKSICLFVYLSPIMFNIEQIIELLKLGKLIPEEIVYSICLKAQELFIQEANVTHVDTPVTICGDIHGQLHDLLTLFQKSGGIENTRYIFLGDFVDRGFYSLESFLLLLCYKLRYPDRIILIRGNHETRQITKVYGFYDEILRKYGNSNVWRYCCEVFDYLSLGAIINSQIFCVHGGLSPDVSTIQEIRSIDRKQEVPHEGAMCDLLWSDPDDVDTWSLSPRGAGFLFGENEVNKFLHENGFNLIARAHQLVMEGYKEMFNSGLVTVWSAPNYCYRCGNIAAVLKVNDDMSRNYTIFEAVQPQDNVGNAIIPTKKPQMDYFL